MSNSKEKVQQSGTESFAHCDFCKEEDLTENAVAFCTSCWKYLCSACVKSHGKFLPDHRLKNGADMPKKDVVTSHFRCEIHTNYRCCRYVLRRTWQCVLSILQVSKALWRQSAKY